MAILKVDDFFDALNKLELEEIEKHKKTIAFYETNNLLPIHLWVADKKRAVFTVPSFDTEVALEHGFSTTDANLIACLRSIWQRYIPESSEVESP
jgi:hypothetical protein